MCKNPWRKSERDEATLNIVIPASDSDLEKQLSKLTDADSPISATVRIRGNATTMASVITRIRGIADIESGVISIRGDSPPMG
jgi:hypothetical protein